MLTRSRLTALILMIVLAFPPAVHSAPMGQAGCAGNLLRNPGFEEAFSARGAREVEVASAWEPWWHNGSEAETSEGFLRRPEYKPESLAAFGPRRIHSGNWAQKWFTTYATHTGGIFQRVEVPVDSIVTFTAWAQVWSSQDPNPDTVVNPGKYGVSVGIDPTGGTDGNSPNVVWSPEVVQYNTWINLKVEAKARAGAVTVFLRGRPEYRNRYNDSYWDDACLTAIPPTPRPTNTPPPTNTPQPTPTPTVTPTVTPTATPRPGTIRVYAFQDYNGNGTRDEGDALLPGAVFTVTVASGRLVGAYTTDGLSEPRSFAGLEPGAYEVGANAPLGYMPVGVNSWRVMVEPAGQTDVGLAATFIPTMTPTRRPTATVTPIAPTATPTPAPSKGAALGASLYNLSGLIIIAFAVGLIVGIYVLRRGRRAKRT